MLSLGIDPHTVTNPYLVRLADLHGWVPLHELDLALELADQPEVVGIEKSEIAAPRLTHAEISRSRNAAIGLTYDADLRSEADQLPGRAVGRAIVNDYNLEISIALRHH